MSRFINPFTDVGFKLIFGREITKDLLMDFLNSLLKGERTIKDLKFIDKEHLPRFKDGRVAIYDLYCKDENGNEFIVEMQNAAQSFFKNRAVYYLSCALAEQGEKGIDWKFNLKAVYGVFFMNFDFVDAPNKLRTDVILTDKNTKETFSDKMRMIFIQLPEFKKEEHECNTDFERWIYVLKNMETLRRMPFQAQNAVFKKLESIVNLTSLSREERQKYDSAIKAYRDYHNQMDFAKETGKQEGLQQGRQEGLKLGLQQGKRESLLKTAINLKRMGLPTDMIQQATGLSGQEIEQL